MKTNVPKIILAAPDSNKGATRALQAQLDLEKKRVRNLQRENERIKGDLKGVQEFTDQITSNVPLSIIIVDSEKRVSFVNRNFCRAMGKKPEELRKRTLDSIFPETFYGPIDLIEKVGLVLYSGGRSISRFTMEYRGNSYAYRILPVSGRSHGRQSRTEKQAMILIENLSELKELGEKVRIEKEKYQTLFESSPDGILLAQGGGRILEANRQALKFLNMTRVKLKKLSLLQLYPTSERALLRRQLREIKSGRRTTHSVDLPEIIRKRENSTPQILSVTTSPIYHRGEKAILFILRDITEKRYLGDQVRQAEKMSLLGQFTAGAAHEINNPLAIISSHAQYLLSQLNGGEIKGSMVGEIMETLNLIDRESQYCGGIIGNLLGFTHSSEAIKKPVDLGSVVRESLKMVDHQLKLSNVNVNCKISSDPIRVLGDANLLQQVLMNLIWNAQGAMPKGGKLGITICSEKNGFAELSVEDTGIGIPKENLEKIFTPFFTTKEIGKGTGLGLWVVRSILDEYQGKVEVESKLGKGTRFMIRFPTYLEEHGNNSHH